MSTESRFVLDGPDRYVNDTEYALAAQVEALEIECAGLRDAQVRDFHARCRAEADAGHYEARAAYLTAELAQAYASIDEGNRLATAANRGLARMREERDSLRATTAELDEGLRDLLRKHEAILARLASAEAVAEKAQGCWREALHGTLCGPCWAALGQALDAHDTAKAVKP